MRYLLRERLRGEENTAGVKARDDIEDILINKTGYKPLDYVTEVGESRTPLDIILNHRRKSRQLKDVIADLKKGDELIIQFPMFADSVFHYKVFRSLAAKGVSVTLIIHDLELFRGSIRRDISFKKRIKNTIEEKNVLKCARKIIVHNSRMYDILRKEGIPEDRMALINIFDYLIPGYEENISRLQEHIRYGKPIIIAGALRKHKAGYAYDLPADIEFNLYGVGYEGEPRDNVHYFGAFPPDDLPFEIEGSFGLVWDGLTSDTCSGVYGEYLKINNPHKTSLYLAAGIPVVIWSEAALAGFIKENNCGITVSSLHDIPVRFAAMSEEEYYKIKQNALKAGERLRAGYYIKNALGS